MRKIVAEYYHKTKNRWEYKLDDGKIIHRSRHIMEQHLGRSLEDDEVVHHINGDTLDDRLENLQLMTKFEHNSYHKTLENNPLWKGEDASYKAKWARDKRRGKLRGPTTWQKGEKHPNWKGDKASDHAKYMREWNKRKRVERS